MPHNQQPWTGRKVLRFFASVGITGFGAYCTFVLGDAYAFGYGTPGSGIPATYFGIPLMIGGALGLCGVNVFRGGPLDVRRDPPSEPDSIDSQW
jgi:hypothetical protein